MRKHKRNGKRHLDLRYTSLEERRLLAMLLSGTEGNDRVEVTHVDTNIVTVKINDIVMENLDISDGVRINTKGGSQDRVWIDHRITADIGVFNAEELELSGGDNFWQIGFKVDPPPEGSIYYDPIGLPGKVAGRINNNITFLGTSTLRSGSGLDRYSINTESIFGLSIYGGEGNDLFRFSAAHNNFFYPALNDRPSLVAYGEGGHDRFVIRGQARVTARGGAGFDILDFRQASYGATEFAGDVMDGEWGNGNERIIGNPELSNQFTSRSSGTINYNLNWIIDGNRTAVSDNAHGAFVELINFNQFTSDSHGLDYFWVLETGDEIRISDADWIQISSDFQATKGKLDTIQHNISIVKESQQLSPAHPITGNSEDPSLLTIAGLSPSVPTLTTIDLDGVYNPRVIISDATGNGSVAVFGEDQTIEGLTGGLISFVDYSASAYSNHAGILPYLPEIVIHGSLTAADYFTFKNTWSPTTVYSHGGDDAFMFGEMNKNANGRLDGIAGEVSIYAGAGTDRMYLNDQAPFLGTTGYRVNEAYIRDNSRYGLVSGSQAVSTAVVRQPRFADIHFDGDLEVARINGSATVPNKFDVVPSARTRFVLHGSENSDDQLYVDTHNKNGELFESNHNGAWVFSDQTKNVYFFGIESVQDVPFLEQDIASTFYFDAESAAGADSESATGADSDDDSTGSGTNDALQTVDYVFETI